VLGPKPFPAIRYKQPKAASRQLEIERFIGIDTEAYQDGTPFMICSSEGDIWTAADMPGVFFAPKFFKAHFLFYNMKYDSGAILRCFLKPINFRELVRYGETTWNELDVRYIPHKYLLLKQGNIRREFWDISQYYPGSLENAASTYLGEHKIDVGSKRFTRPQVRREWKKLARYCIQDAKLTARLGDYFKRKLNEFGIDVCSLYSPASLSFRYFQQKVGVIDVWELYNMHPQALLYAHEAYQGGKFEIQQRGTFSGFEYDIVSAYPFEIANLIDITRCKVVHSRTPVEDAPYAFLRCRIRHMDPKVPPCHGLLLQGVRVYALGTYYVTITLNEYLYLIENHIEVDILDGYWIVPRRRRHPYRATIEYLFSIKDKYKKTDAMLYAISKVMMNGYYGKFCQLTEKIEPAEDHPDLKPGKTGEVSVYDAGSAWNPIYAAIITANTRLAVCRLQQRVGDACIAIHTDSVITTKPLAYDALSSALGGVKLEVEGEGLVWGCGMYDMAGKTAYRGFEMGRGFSWRKLFQEHPLRSKYRYPQTRVMSWTQATVWDRLAKINVFSRLPKMVDLNADVKRLWQRERVRGRHLLAGLESGEPRMHVDNVNPWQ
jgi:hypothetical protein